MSELPRTDELPRVGEGYDPGRVEEAFAGFAERVRELEAVAGELRAELRSLRAERAAPAFVDSERWPVEPVAGAASPDWIAAVPAPLAGRSAVPRLAVEGAFLLLVALFAGLADLSPGWIALVMAAAWGLVVSAEWANAARRARWRLDEIAPALGTGQAAETTGPWDAPIVEATVVAAEPDPESKTVVTTLPAEPEEGEPDEAAPEPEATPKRRWRFRRRKEPVEAGTADPWET